VTYEIRIPRRVERTLDKLDADVNARIRRKLRDLEHDPFRFCTRLVGSDCYRLRVGSYRVILDIDRNELVILVIEVVPRSKAYR
jgi:mRNA interferase RelE/StbE